MTNVKIEWNWLDWHPHYRWSDDIEPQLMDANLTEDRLSRCVYVIRANGLFAIKYPNGISPTLYIGEGNFKNRIIQHKNWLEPIVDLVGDFSFQIGVCLPRVRNNRSAYKDFEAALLIEFRKIYGSAPLRNRQMERRRNDYNYEPKAKIREAIMIGKGGRYHWALEPMPSSSIYDDYWYTHQE